MEKFRTHGPHVPRTGRVLQTIQALEISKLCPSSISASNGGMGPLGGEREYRCSYAGGEHLHTIRGPKYIGALRIFFPVDRLLVTETTCGFWWVRDRSNHQRVVFRGITEHITKGNTLISPKVMIVLPFLFVNCRIFLNEVYRM